MELDRHRDGSMFEVVMLEAENIDALKKTHRRYFECLEPLTHPPGE